MKLMNFLYNRKALSIALLIMTLGALSVTVLSETGFSEVVRPVVELINSLLTPVLAVVGAAGSIYCVFLGIKYAKAEEVQEREKAKSHLKNAIIGFVLIFVLILGLRLLMPVMEKWVAEEAAKATSDI